MQGTPVTVPLTCTDANDNTPTLSIASGPANGTLGTINQSPGTVTYPPRPGFTGTDSFYVPRQGGVAVDLNGYVGNGTFHDPVDIDADAAGNSREAVSAAGATLKAGAIARLGARRSHGEPDWMYPI